nr:hypothetical protein Itr_chr10CG13490 [Ipomoea trifida]
MVRTFGHVDCWLCSRIGVDKHTNWPPMDEQMENSIRRAIRLTGWLLNRTGHLDLIVAGRWTSVEQGPHAAYSQKMGHQEAYDTLHKGDPIDSNSNRQRPSALDKVLDSCREGRNEKETIKH